MLPRARYRCLLYILVLLCAYIAIRMMAEANETPGKSFRINRTVYVDSLNSNELKVIDSADAGSVDGVYIAVILINVIESPVYFRDVYNYPTVPSSRIEIGKHIDLRPGFSYTAESNLSNADVRAIESEEFLRNSILAATQGLKFSPAMQRALRKGTSLGGRVLNYPKLITVVIVDMLWVLGWVALLAEGVLAYYRGKRHQRQRHCELCFQCSYQLSRDMVQCPECGQQIHWRAYAMNRT